LVCIEKIIWTNLSNLKSLGNEGCSVEEWRCYLWGRYVSNL